MANTLPKMPTSAHLATKNKKKKNKKPKLKFSDKASNLIFTSSSFSEN